MTRSRHPFCIVANWKMNLSRQQAEDLVRTYATLPLTYPLIICPAHPWLVPIGALIQGSPHLILGAQDCSAHTQGAFTGDVSASMIRDCGARYVLIGHSERRLIHHEQHAMLVQKIACARQEGLTPILCVGEPSIDAPIEVLLDQLMVLEDHLGHNAPFVVAYEPVWAIGTGLVPSTERVGSVIQMIRRWFTMKPEPPIFYGGSVNATNAGSFRALCDGLLVGGASLDQISFYQLIKALENN